MKRLLTTLCIVLIASLQSFAVTTDNEAAEEIINRFMGPDCGLTVNVQLDLTAVNGKDRFSYNLSGTTLEVHASSPVAACRGFYDFVTSNKAGICSWSGNRFQMPQNINVCSRQQTSPYRDHQYYNVVTYGYTTPYWDEERWDREIDWMALHGVDMPLMLVAAEAIYRRVFTQAPFNLTEAQVDAWEVGPAHLPWFRMGNLSGNSFDGPLGNHWNQRQIALAHHILDRMKRLGMKPICPAFGGFVPLALAQKYPGQFSYTGWNWVPQSYRNYRLNPDTDAFVEVGKRFIQEWEKEFGTCTYYLSDSFNEMTVPDDLDVLTGYGDHVFKCINEGSSNPDAVWVTQGWTFVYQAGEWGKNKFNALTKNVPHHRFNMLYMSPEYGNGKWNSPYEGFNGHDWTITMLPNMGGKNFYNGGINDYATTWRTQYTTNCQNLTGWGMTPEGVENNELIYELICDAGWTPSSTSINVTNWKQKYAMSRYGIYSDDIKDFLQTLHNTVLSRYTDHKCFGWQGYNKTSGYINPGADPGEDYYRGTEAFLSAENLAKYRQNCPTLLRYDLIEAAAFYAGARVDKLNKRIKAANTAGRKDEAKQLVQDLKTLMTQMDRLLTAHPLYDEQKWEDRAARMAGANTQGSVTADQSEKARYVKNARRIVSLWYGDHSTAANGHEPVNDYACRVWAGLIRDYYLPRLVAEWENVIDGHNNNLRDIENTFINAQSLSQVQGGSLSDQTSDADIMDAIVSLVTLAKEAGEMNFERLTQIIPSTDTQSHWYAIRSAGSNFNLRVMTTTPELDGNLTSTLTAQDQNGTTSQVWRFFKYGNIYRIENRNGMSMSYNATTGKPVTYLANIDTDITMTLHGKAATDSKSTAETEDTWGIIPAATGNSNTAYHMNSSQGLMVWDHERNGKYVTDTSWSIEEVTSIGETYDEDYSRYRRRLTGFQSDMYGDATLIGKVGQPKTENSIQNAIARLGNYTAGDHETYDDFLTQRWAPLWTEAINLPDASKPQACRLFDLIISAFQMKPSPVNQDANEALAVALRKAQTTLAAENLTESQARTAATTLQTAIRSFISVYNINSGQIADGTWNAESWKTADAQHVSCFPEAANLDISNLSVSADNSTVWVEMKYTGGSHRQDTYGMELIDSNGSVAYSNYHTGNTGGVHNNNTYQVSGVKAGTYTVRCWSACRANNEDINSTGNITVKVNGTQSKTATWNSQSWMIDNTLLTSSTLRAMYAMVGTKYYKYMEVQAKIPASTVSATYTYTGGQERVDLIGVEVLDANNNVVASDGHFGYTGSSHSRNTYTLKIPAEGSYTIRTWANYVRPFAGAVAGNITYSVQQNTIANHQPFLIKNPSEAEGGDGRGTLCLYTGNDGTGTDAPICVDIEKYPSMTHSNWPTTSTASGVYTSWAKFTSNNDNTYIYNIQNGRFLSTDNANHVVFSNTPAQVTINPSNDHFQITNSNGQNLCFTPGWGQAAGYYALWNNENRSDLCALIPQSGTVSNEVRNAIEEKVEIYENGQTAITGIQSQESESPIYDLQGHHLSRPTQGVNIIGNRKVIVGN